MSKPLIIIPAAGYANRLRPISKFVSNAMIPINGKPIISYIIDEIKKIGESDIVIIINEFRDVEYFLKQSYNDHLSISYVIQKNQKGPLDAIRLGYEFAKKEFNENYSNVLVWLGDTIFLSKDKSQTAMFRSSKSFAITSFVDDYKRWCLVDDNSFYLYDKSYKNPNVNKALIGIYNFGYTEGFFLALKKALKEPTFNGAYQISSLINWYLKHDSNFLFLDETDQWYDCGELQSYYETRSRLLNKSARSFNNMQINTFFNSITKQSKEKKDKIEKEKNWFKRIYENEEFNDLQNFIPKILNSPNGILQMSLEPGTPLNEVWLYDNLSGDSWITIIRKILKVQNEIFYKPPVKADDLQLFKDDLQDLIIEANKKMYLEKNLKRLEEFKEFPEFNLVYDFVKETGEILSDKNNIQSYKHWSKIFHGDGHIGNIIYEPSTGGLKFIDPRGEFGDLLDVGDIRYDMGKMLHDFYCGYPNILANQYKEEGSELKILWDENKINEILSFIFKELEIYDFDVEQIKRLSIVLIVTCLPFHADDKKRQLAFWKRGINLIKSDFKKYE